MKPNPWMTGAFGALLAVSLVTFSGCNDNKQVEEKLTNLQTQIDALKEDVAALKEQATPKTTVKQTASPEESTAIVSNFSDVDEEVPPRRQDCRSGGPWHFCRNR